jgi:site-specific recombinase XerD
MQRIIENAVKKGKICKDVSELSRRHRFATHLLENGIPIGEMI